jgi:putative SOS response-associated peptidase YedK
MCNLYSMTTSREAILRLFRISENRAAAVVPKDAIFPGHDAPVVRPAADGVRELVQMSWGFVLPQPGRTPRRVTNTRDNKARLSSFWRNSFENRRCLVPVTCFAEPRGTAVETEKPPAIPRALEQTAPQWDGGKGGLFQRSIRRGAEGYC